MSVIEFELFRDGAEIVGHSCSRDRMAEIHVSPTADGFITLNGITARVVEGRCVFDLRLIDDGEFSPVLIEKDRRTVLPRIKKESLRISPAEPDGEYIRRLSARTRLLERKLDLIEDELTNLKKKILGTTIF